MPGYIASSDSPGLFRSRRGLHGGRNASPVPAKLTLFRLASTTRCDEQQIATRLYRGHRAESERSKRTTKSEATRRRYSENARSMKCDCTPVASPVTVM